MTIKYILGLMYSCKAHFCALLSHKESKIVKYTGPTIRLCLNISQIT